MSRLGTLRRFAMLALVHARESLRGRRPFAHRIVLLSYPRSGSSWIGEVLSKSPGAIYLREPVTQPYLRVYGGTHAMVDLGKHRRAAIIQVMLRTLALNDATIDRPGQIRSQSESPVNGGAAPALLIKEVNPRAAPLYCSQEGLCVVLLMRHPAAVAYSFWRLGWLTADDTQAIPPGVDAPDEWACFGYAYGTSMAAALEEINTYPGGQVISYEDLASSPERAFSDLFERCELDTPDNFGELMMEYTQAPGASTGRHETRRDSKATAIKWTRELAPEAIASIRRGFEASALDYYRSDSDWAAAPGDPRE